MSYVLVTLALMCLALLWALLAGQPAAAQQTRAERDLYATEVVQYRATALSIHPTPTPGCYLGSQITRC